MREKGKAFIVSQALQLAVQTQKAGTKHEIRLKWSLFSPFPHILPLLVVGEWYVELVAGGLFYGNFICFHVNWLLFVSIFYYLSK